MKNGTRNKLAVVLKTHKGDLSYVERLLGSYLIHNVDGLPLYVVCPARDLETFSQVVGSSGTVIADEEIPVQYAGTSEEHSGPAFGIINAGISKLAFWELNLSENYFAVDSDMVFIRNFRMVDFLAEDGTPLLAFDQGLNEQIDRFYFQNYWTSRKHSLSRVCSEIGVNNPFGLTTHNSQVMNNEILHSFRDEFLLPRGWTYREAMLCELYEFFWYGAWAMKRGVSLANLTQSFVKMVQHQGEHLSLYNSGVRSQDLSRAYLGVIVNSNWSRQYGIVDFDNPPVDEYLSRGRWAEWLSNAKT